MKLETLNALAQFAEEVTRGINAASDPAPLADTSSLFEAKRRLLDALEQENVDPPTP